MTLWLIKRGFTPIDCKFIAGSSLNATFCGVFSIKKKSCKQATKSRLSIYVNKMTFIDANGLTPQAPKITFRER